MISKCPCNVNGNMTDTQRSADVSLSLIYLDDDSYRLYLGPAELECSTLWPDRPSTHRTETRNAQQVDHVIQLKCARIRCHRTFSQTTSATSEYSKVSIRNSNGLRCSSERRRRRNTYLLQSAERQNLFTMSACRTINGRWRDEYAVCVLVVGCSNSVGLVEFSYEHQQIGRQMADLLSGLATPTATD
jgi:hypothetical protein